MHRRCVALVAGQGQPPEVGIVAQARHHRQALPEVCLLGILAELHVAAVGPVHPEAGCGVGHQRARLEGDPRAVVLQQAEEIVVHLGAVAQGGELQQDRPRHAEQLHHLVEQVRPQVVPDPPPGRWFSSQRSVTVGPEAIEARLQRHHPPQGARLEQPLEGQEIAVPAAIVEDAQATLGVIRLGAQQACLGERHREGLVHHHMLARGERRLGQREVGIVGGGDDHQVDIATREQGRRLGQYLHLRQVGVDPLGITADHGGELHALGGLDQGACNTGPGLAVTDQPDAERMGLHRSLP